MNFYPGKIVCRLYNLKNSNRLIFADSPKYANIKNRKQPN